MDISKYKELLQRVGVFKNYSSVIVPAAIGLVGIIVFVMTLLTGSGLRAEIQRESVTKGMKKIKKLRMDPDSLDQHIEERKYQDAYKDDANAINNLAVRGSDRALLDNEIFPEPREKTQVIFERFGKKFCGAVDNQMERLNARGCPTDVEIERERKNQKANLAGRRRKLNVRRLKSEIDSAIIEELCCDKAESSFVYAIPTDLSGYELWEDGASESWADSMRNAWYSQLAYWIIEDVADTIEVRNSGSSNVYTSPVKRLMFISFIDQFRRMRRSSRTASGKKETDLPSYVLTTIDGLAEIGTKRICDDYIDVVHFNVGVVVSTKDVLPFMRQLCSAKEHRPRAWDGKSEEVLKHNQITILGSKLTPVRRDAAEHKYYRYGEDAVAQLELTCEYVFVKSGYDDVKPKYVKDGVAEELKKLEEEARKKRRRRRRPTTNTTDGIGKIGKKDFGF
jgi:hypothetical protein